MVGLWLSHLSVGREFTCPCEYLREVSTTVHENCSMSRDGDSLADMSAYEVKREMYRICTSGEMVGHDWRKMSVQVGISRVESG